MALQAEKGPNFRYQESLERAAEDYGTAGSTLSAPFRAVETAGAQLMGGAWNIGLTAAAEGVGALGEATGVEGVKEDAAAIRGFRDSIGGLVRRFSDEQAAIDAKGVRGTASVRQGLAALGEAAAASATGGLPALAGYYAANSGASSIAEAEAEGRTGVGKYAPAAAHAVIEGAATLLGGKLGSGTAALAQRAGKGYGTTVVGKAVGKVAEKFPISKPLAELFGAAGAEVTEEVATEVAHYYTDLAQPGEYQGASLRDRVTAVVGPSLVAGGAGRALDTLLGQLERREKAIAPTAELARKVEANEPVTRGDLERAGIPSNGTNAKTRVERAKKELDSVQLPEATNEQASPEAAEALRDVPANVAGGIDGQPEVLPSSDGGQPAPAPQEAQAQEGPVESPPPVPVAPVQQGSAEPDGGELVNRRKLETRIRKLREKNTIDDDTFDDIDMLSSYNTQYLNDAFNESQRLADIHNQEAASAREEWSTVFGDQHAKSGAKARRGAARGSDAAGALTAFDQTVQFLRDNPEAAPGIRAAAERIGDGDLESGLFQVLQGGKQQFAEKTAEDFLPDVVRQAADDLTSFGPEMGENFFVARERTNEQPKKLISAENITRTFPGAKVSQRSDSRWRVKLPNGVNIQVASVPNLQINPEYAARIRSRYPGVSDAQWAKVEAAGLYHVVARNGEQIPVRSLIALSESMGADQKTLTHEALHAAKSMGLFTDEEWGQLKDKYAGGLTDEGAIEEAIAQGMERQPARKLSDRIRQFFNKLLKALGFRGFSPNMNRILADEEFWSRSARQQQAGDTQFQLKSRDPEVQRKLANIGTSQEVRDHLAELDRIATEAGEPGIHKDEEVNAEVDKRLAADYDGIRDRIVKTGLRGGQLDEYDTVAAKRIFEKEAYDALKSGDADALAEISTLRDVYRATGTAQARAFRQRQDPLNGKGLADATPEERQNSIVDDIYRKPPKEEKQREKALKNGDTKTVEKIDKAWAKRLQNIEDFLNELGLSLDDIETISKDPLTTARAKGQINAAGTNWDDKLYEYWQNLGLLSGPTTQIVNITGNVASGFWEFGINRPIEALVNSGNLDPSGAQPGEIPHIWRGLRRGVTEGFRNALVTWSTELPVTQESKWDTPRVAIGGTTGRVVRAFGWRPLSTADEFFNSLFANLQVGAEAYRQAKIQGLEGDELSQFIDSQVADKNSLSWRFARIHSAELTFQQQQEGYLASTLGRIGRGWRNDRIGRWVVPFATFPVNAATVALRKAPVTGDVAMAAKVWRNIQEGNRPTFGMSRYAAERIVAWGVLAMLAASFDEDDPWITGSKTAPQGAPKNSIRIGDKWYEYGRIEPLATTLSLVVDGLMTLKTGDTDAIVGAPLDITASQISDKTFLRGIADMMTVAGVGGSEGAKESPTNRVAGWAARFGESFVPNFYRQTREALRPNKSEYKVWGTSPGEKLARTGERFAEGVEVPGTRYDLKVDPWGRPVQKSEAPFWSAPLTDTTYRLLSPTQNAPNQPTIGDKVMARWNNRNPDAVYTLRPPTPYYTIDGEKKSMTGEEYESFQIAAGKAANAAVEEWAKRSGKAVADGAVEPTAEHFQQFKKIIAGARKRARAKMVARIAGRPKRKIGESTDKYIRRLAAYNKALKN